MTEVISDKPNITQDDIHQISWVISSLISRPDIRIFQISAHHWCIPTSYRPKKVLKPIPMNHILNPKTHLRLWYHSLRPTLDEDLGSKFLGTNLDSFEANWILELDLALDPSLHLGSPNHELSLWALFLGPNQLIFPIKWCHV